MDAFSGLAFLGNYLNTKKDNNVNNTQKSSSRYTKSRPNGDNIYNSNQYSKAVDYTNKKADKRHNESRNPMNTGVIPNFYNQQDNDSVFSDDISAYSNNSNKGYISNHTDLYDRGNDLMNNNSNTSPEFFGQFNQPSFNNPSDPVASNSANNMIGPNSTSMRTQLERDLALKEGFSNYSDCGTMDYGIIGSDNLTHNNMVPFFSGSGSGYGISDDSQNRINETTQRKLDLFTGSLDSLDYTSKIEHRPLFNPVENLTNIYGMPNFTEYMSGRYMPSMERRNELPAEPIKVTPGLN